MKGSFIVIEGADGAGTTTQTLALCKALEIQFQKTNHARHAIYTAEPFKNDLGKHLRSLLSVMEPDKKYTPLLHDEIALSFALNRLQHYNNYIAPHLKSGNSVICDRHTLSSLVYQSISSDYDWVKSINAKAPKPDMVIFLDTPLSVCIERIKSRNTQLEYFESDLFSQNIHQRYYDEVQKDPSIVRIDGARDASRITQEILRAISPLFNIPLY